MNDADRLAALIYLAGAQALGLSRSWESIADLADSIGFGDIATYSRAVSAKFADHSKYVIDTAKEIKSVYGSKESDDAPNTVAMKGVN